MRKKRQRVVNKPSNTAAWTCTSRALSFLDEPPYKSGDYIAPEILPGFLSLLFKAGFFRKTFIKDMIPSGMYEYVIARTRYFDSVFETALKNGIQQILIFGAGYDSRGIRLLNGQNTVCVYELDAPKTQGAKIDQFKKRGIKVNPNIVFIPIDFNKESLEDKLIAAGFKKDRKSLTMMKGLVMYLDREAVDATFKLVNEFSAAGSEIVFDYIYACWKSKTNCMAKRKSIKR